MEPVAKKRPTSVTVIGWLFIVGALLMVFSGSMGSMIFFFMKRMGGNDILPGPEDISGPLGGMSIIFQHFGLVLLLQIILGFFVLISAIQFLKLRAWARTTLETVSWLGLIYTIGFGIFWIFSWISMTSNVPQGVQGPPPMFEIFGMIIGAVVTLVWSVPLIVIIKFLRGKTIKEAVV